MEMTLKSLDELNRDFLFESLESRGWEAEKAEKTVLSGAAAGALPAGAAGFDLAGSVTETKAEAEAGERKKSRMFLIISDALFYLAISMILLSVLSSSSRGTMTRMLLGHAYFTVLSSSMQGELPTTNA